MSLLTHTNFDFRVHRDINVWGLCLCNDCSVMQARFIELCDMTLPFLTVILKCYIVLSHDSHLLQKSNLISHSSGFKPLTISRNTPKGTYLWHNTLFPKTKSVKIISLIC